MISKRFNNDSKPLVKLNLVQKEARKRVESKINDGKYTFEIICCPICDSTHSEILSKKDRYGLNNQVVVCKNCGLVITNPRMTKDSYIDFYENEYRKLYLGTETPKESYFKRQYKRAESIYKYISNSSKKSSFNGLKVLEVGCGAGGILAYFRNNGCTVVGVDLDLEYIKYGIENHKLNLIQGSLINVPKDFNPDIIIYSHVLEHILDVNSELKYLRETCHDDTIIYIEVPGIKNIHNDYKMDSLLYFQNAHTHHFTLKSLTNLFHKNGFSLVCGNEFIKCIFSINGKGKNHKIENDYFDVTSYLKKIEKNRFLYYLKPSTIRKKIISITKPNEIRIFRNSKE